VLRYSGIAEMRAAGSVDGADIETDAEEGEGEGMTAGRKKQDWKAVCLSWPPAWGLVRTLQHAMQ
jgi:hypothetical protein